MAAPITSCRLCKTWLKVIDTEVEDVGSSVKMRPIRLTSSGLCAGLLLGISDTLRMRELTCPPYRVSNDELVGMVVGQMEKRPEEMDEEFGVLTNENDLGLAM